MSLIVEINNMNQQLVQLSNQISKLAQRVDTLQENQEKIRLRLARLEHMVYNPKGNRK